MSSRTDFSLTQLLTPPHLLSCQILCTGKNGFFWKFQMCWLATTASPSPVQCKALTTVSLPPTKWLWISRHFIISGTFSCLEIWLKLARDIKRNSRATNRWADWCHEQKKSDFKIFTSSLHYITCFWNCLFPEENEPCIFTCTAFCYFSMQLSYRNEDTVIFSSKVKEETCRTIS